MIPNESYHNKLFNVWKLDFWLNENNRTLVYINIISQCPVFVPTCYNIIIAGTPSMLWTTISIENLFGFWFVFMFQNVFGFVN